MPDVRLVDVEALLVAYYTADAGLAALVADRVSTELPAAFQPEARLQVIRSGGAPVDAETQHLDRALVQLLAYGATKAEAFDVALEALRATFEAADADHELGVVTGAERVLGPTWSPDPPTDAPRYLTTFAVFAHP